MTTRPAVKVFVLCIFAVLQVTYMVWTVVSDRQRTFDSILDPSANSPTAADDPVKILLRNSSSSLSEPRDRQHQSHRNTSALGQSCSHLKRNFSGNGNSHFLIDSSDGCSTGPTVVIIVASSVSSWNLRETIRATWASLEDRTVKVLFLVGRSLNRSIESCVYAEEEAHKDIIMANVIDSYSNLSLKSVAMLRWMMSFCSSAKFLIKADDDSFLNTPLLLKDLAMTSHQRFIMGNVIALAKPVREPGSKWFTPHSVFNRSSYPTYVSGMAYVISGDAIASLYSASLRIPLFWLEDIYITGLLAGAEKIQLVFNGKFDGFKDLMNECLLKSHIVRHRISVEEMRTLWRIVLNAQHDDRCLSLRQQSD